MVGSGHNGLVAACYLAVAGCGVQVVESDTVLGGAVSTVERWPGHLIDRGSSAHIMIRHTGIVEELDLERHGLHYLDLDPWAFLPFEGGDITFHVDLDTTCTSIEKACGTGDADAYRRFAQDWAGRNAAMFRAFQHRPSLSRLGRALWDMRRSSGVGALELTRQLLGTGDALLDEHFADERLKTALSWLGAQAGPPTHHPATAELVGWSTVNHLVAPGHPRGGSGKLTEALASRLRAAGGEVRLGDGAASITVSGDRITGVLTESGEHLPADVVIAGCHVLTTLRLLGHESLLARAHQSVRVGNGMGMVVRLATSDLPRYPTATPASYRAMQLLASSRSALRRAHGEFSAGLPPTEPAVLAMTFSAFDDTLAPPGAHNVSLWGQWHPYALAGGEHWPDIAEREADKLVQAVDRAAPGFASTVQQVHIQSPLELERELGLPRGQVMHVDMAFDSMFRMRPLPELSRQRVPGLRGMYLCGASTHPGGGVFGASGRTAARLVLADQRGRGGVRTRKVSGG